MKNYTLGDFYGALLTIVFCVLLSVTVNSCRERVQEKQFEGTPESIAVSTCVYLVRYERCEYLTYCQGGIVHSQTCPNHVR